MFRAVLRRHSVGGGAPVYFGRRRRAPGQKKSAAWRRQILEKIYKFVLSSKSSDDLFFSYFDRKLHENMYTAVMPSAARRQIIGGGGVPMNKSWRRRLT